jgi:hypothetical protein
MTTVITGSLGDVAGPVDIDRGVWERLARLYAEMEKRDWEGWNWDHFHGNRLRGLVNTELRNKGLKPADYYVIITPERPPKGPIPKGWSPDVWYLDLRLVEGALTEQVDHAPTIAEKS